MQRKNNLMMVMYSTLNYIKKHEKVYFVLRAFHSRRRQNQFGGGGQQTKFADYFSLARI